MADAQPKPNLSLMVGEIAQDRLRLVPDPGLRGVSCDYEQGVLILRGQVPAFYHKQLAQEAIVHVEGVTRVVNKIEVAD
jgi:osmotically-inducible protein OsmY